MRSYAKDASESHVSFVQIVWPSVAPVIRNGEFLPVECVTDDELCRRLDQLAGIDAWQVLDGQGMRGIASRVQGGTWDTFTIRYERDSGAETEWVKRCRALDEPQAGWLLPALTIQAYVNDGKLYSAAVIRTADLFLYAREHLGTDAEKVWTKQNRRDAVGDSNLFVVVSWGALHDDGVKVVVLPRDHKCRDYRKRVAP